MLGSGLLVSSAVPLAVAMLPILAAARTSPITSIGIVVIIYADVPPTLTLTATVVWANLTRIALDSGPPNAPCCPLPRLSPIVMTPCPPLTTPLRRGRVGRGRRAGEEKWQAAGASLREECAFMIGWTRRSS